MNFKTGIPFNIPNRNIALSLLISVGILIRLAYLLVLSSVNPSGILFHDSFDYIHLGNNLYHSGQFSRELAAPFYPEHIRVPFYPLIVGFFNNNYLGIIIFQIILSGLNTFLLFNILEQLKLKYTTVLLVTALLVLNITSVALSNIVLTEIISETLLLGAIYFSIKFLKTNKHYFLLFSSVFLGFLIFTKPLYLWVVPLSVLFLAIKMKRYSLLMLLLIPGLIYVAWSIRNYKTFGSFFYANIDVQNLAFFRVAQIDSELNGYSIEINQELIRTETAEKLKGSFNKIYEHDTPLYYQQLKNDALDKVLKHPLLFVKLNVYNACKLVFNPVNKIIYYQFDKNEEMKEKKIRMYSFKERLIHFFSDFSILDLLLFTLSIFYSLLVLVALLFCVRYLFLTTSVELTLIAAFCLLIFVLTIGPEADARLRYAFEPLAILLLANPINNYFSNHDDKEEFN